MYSSFYLKIDLNSSRTLLLYFCCHYCSISECRFSRIPATALMFQSMPKLPSFPRHCISASVLRPALSLPLLLSVNRQSTASLQPVPENESFFHLTGLLVP